MDEVDEILAHVRLCSLAELRVLLNVWKSRRPADFQIVRIFLLTLEQDERFKHELPT